MLPKRPAQPPAPHLGMHLVPPELQGLGPISAAQAEPNQAKFTHSEFTGLRCSAEHEARAGEKVVLFFQ